MVLSAALGARCCVGYCLDMAVESCGRTEDAGVDTPRTTPAVAGTSVSNEALDAHHQVLEMASTIELLRRDLEQQQLELSEAYRRLEEYRQMETRPSWTGTDSSAQPIAARTSTPSECKAEGLQRDELNELRKMVNVKDSALNEALQQRNEYKITLEKAEETIKALRNGQKRTVPASKADLIRTASAHTLHTTAAPPQLATSASYANSLVVTAPDVPHNERFDDESSYQRRENDDVFWRKQYREAVRMRKHHGLVPSSKRQPLQAPTASRSAPSLKIFSFPDNRRQKGIKDENVPFTRYIGISSRQNAIISEQHRLLS